MLKLLNTHVDFNQPIDDALAECNELEQSGYLVVDQFDYTLVYEHPDLGNREDILKRHNQHIEYCKMNK